MFIMQNTGKEDLLIPHCENMEFSGFGAFNGMLPSHTHSILQLSKPRPGPRRRVAPKCLGQVHSLFAFAFWRKGAELSPSRPDTGTMVGPSYALMPSLGYRGPSWGYRHLFKVLSLQEATSFKELLALFQQPEAFKTRSRAGVWKQGPLTNS